MRILKTKVYAFLLLHWKTIKAKTGDIRAITDQPIINKKTLVDILDSLKYPLYFIDYESIQPAIPVYDGTKPYQQIPFQYSLHIIKEKEAPLEHKEFLADINDENMIRT